MSSENRDNEGDLIDFHVQSPVLPRSSPSFHIYPEASDNLIDTELPILEQKLQTATHIVNPINDSRRTSVDVEDILITIDDDEVDAPQKISDRFLDLCDNNLVDNLEALSVLKSLDDVLNATYLDDVGSIENGEEANNTQDIEDCLKDLDNYLKALDTSGSEDYSDSSNESHDDQPSTRSIASSSDLAGSYSLTDAPELSTDEESLRNKLRQMEENYTKFLASGCINRGYVDTETNESARRPLSACGMTNKALNTNQPGRATVAVIRRERPSLRRAIENNKSRCAPERTSGPAGDSDEDIDWSWLQDIARDVTLERRAHAAGDCCTGTVVVELPRQARPSSSSEPIMNEEPKEEARGSTWLRTSMRRLRHLRLPSNDTPPETESNVTTNIPEPLRLELPTTVRPISAPSRLPPSAVRTSTRSSRARSRESRSAVSHEPGGRARSSSASSRSRRPRSLSSSDSSLASSVDSTPSCIPATSSTQNTQEQPASTVNARRYAFLVAGIFYGISKSAAYSIIEGHVRAEKEKHKAERDAELEAEKDAAAQRDLDEIIKIFTPKPKSGMAVEVHQKGSDGDQESKKTCKLKQNPVEPTTDVDFRHYKPGFSEENVEIRDSGSPKVKSDIFSKSINLKGAEDIEHGSEVQIDLGDDEGSVESKPDQEKKDPLDGYFIQSFPDGVPFIGEAEKKKNTYDFPKDKSE